MKITVVTVCFNSAAFIAKCAESVASQRHEQVEHVFVDNCSSDGTLRIISRVGREGATVISEPDRGIYNAMNKGIALATGDIVCFLNADDWYKGNDVLEKVACAFETGDAEIVVGLVEYVRRSQTGQEVPIRRWNSSRETVLGFRGGWHPPHPAFFIKRALLKNFGGFDENLTIAADYELMLRYVYKLKRRAVFIPETLAAMRTGGVSNRGFANIARANLECYTAWRKNGLRPPLSLIMKPVVKLFAHLS